MSTYPTTSNGAYEEADLGPYQRYALIYLNSGFSPIPLAQGTKVPPSAFPLRKYLNRQPSHDDVLGWMESYPTANIGLLTGSNHNLTVLDVDTKDVDGFATLDSLFDQGLVLTRRDPLVRTGSGGGHYWFDPAGQNYMTRHIKRHGIDFQAEDAYVVVPPSITDYGPYEFLRPEVIVNGQLTEPMPEKLVPLVESLHTAVAPRKIALSAGARTSSWDPDTAEGREFKALWDERGVPIKEGQHNYHCPWHRDRHPSLSINTVTLEWMCHSCGKMGNLLTLRSSPLNPSRQRDVAISHIPRTPTTMSLTTTRRERCPRRIPLYMQFKGSARAYITVKDCDKLWCEVCGPGEARRLAQAYIERFSATGQRMFAMRLRDSVWGTKLRRLERQGNPVYLRIPQDDGLIFVVASKPLSDEKVPGVINMNVQVEDIAGALRSTRPDSIDPRHITASTEIRLPGRNSKREWFVRPLSGLSRFRKKAVELGLMKDEHEWNLKVPLMSDPQWPWVMRELGVALPEPDLSSTSACSHTQGVEEVEVGVDHVL